MSDEEKLAELISQKNWMEQDLDQLRNEIADLKSKIARNGTIRN